MKPVFALRIAAVLTAAVFAAAPALAQRGRGGGMGMGAGMPRYDTATERPSAGRLSICSPSRGAVRPPVCI